MQRASLRLGRVLTTGLCRLASVCLLGAIAASPRPWLVPGLYLLRVWLMNSVSRQCHTQRTAPPAHCSPIERGCYPYKTSALCVFIGLGAHFLQADTQRLLSVTVCYHVAQVSGLTKSILNDYVSRADRGKWNALEYVTDSNIQWQAATDSRTRLGSATGHTQCTPHAVQLPSVHC